MPDRLTSLLAPCALAATLVLSACKSAPAPLYQGEAFDATSSPYAHTFQASSSATCEAARRALLSQGYMASATQSVAIDGSKNFQPNNDSHIVIEFHVVCVDANADGSASTAYVNAVQDRYTLKKSNTSASVGLSVLGSLSLPIGSSDDSLVKVASETIPAGVFYERYFKLVDHFLKIDPVHSTRDTVAKAEMEPVAPLPVPVPTRQDEPMRLKAPDAPASQPEAVPPGSTATPEPASTPAAASAAAVVAPAAPTAPPTPASAPTLASAAAVAVTVAAQTSSKPANSPAAASAAVTASAPIAPRQPASVPTSASSVVAAVPTVSSAPAAVPAAASTPLAAPPAAASDTGAAH